MMSPKLIKLTKAYEKQLGEMSDEWKAVQELNHTNHSPWAILHNWAESKRMVALRVIPA